MIANEETRAASFIINLNNLVRAFSTMQLPQPDIAQALQAAAERFRANTRPCGVCHEPILIGKGYHSKNRMYCSNSCKCASVRQRQQQREARHE